MSNGDFWDLNSTINDLESLMGKSEEALDVVLFESTVWAKIEKEFEWLKKYAAKATEAYEQLDVICEEMQETLIKESK